MSALLTRRLQGHGLKLSAARLVPLTLVCVFPMDRSHFILEASLAPDGSVAALAPVPIDIVRTTIRVQEHGSERLFVASNSNLGSTIREPIYGTQCTGVQWCACIRASKCNAVAQHGLSMQSLTRLQAGPTGFPVLRTSVEDLLGGDVGSV